MIVPTNASIFAFAMTLIVILFLLADVMRINSGIKPQAMDLNRVVAARQRTASPRPRPRLPESARLAIVQVVSPTRTRSVEYLASIYGVNGRIRMMHANATTPPYDHVVMICDVDDPTGMFSSHPLIKVVLYDCTAIKSTVEPHKVWVETFYIVAAMNLTQYDKVLVIDVDTVLLTPVDTMMREMPAPAMTLWGSFGTAASHFDYNSGSVLLKPSKDMYDDAMTMMDDIEIGREHRLALQRQALTSQQRGPMPLKNLSGAQVSTDYSDQEFLTTFWDFSRYAVKHGPLYSLSHKYNMRFEDLGEFDKHFIQYQQQHDPKAFEQVGKGPRWSPAMLCLFGGYCGHSIPHIDDAAAHTTQKYLWNGPSIIHLTPTGKVRTPWPKCSLTHYTMFTAAMDTYITTKHMSPPAGKLWENDQALIKVAKEFCNITVPL
eukprot:m.80970 g.80970  ORF g.80970 m.80970 type:complete len:432 (+) comp25369_c1_seq2:438-1733(+)